MSNDVDEDVYAGDGDERSEPREASDGDRRAIADADHAGQLGFLVKREHHEPDELWNLRRMPRGCCATRLFCGASRAKQDGRHSAEVAGRLHVHTYRA